MKFPRLALAPLALQCAALLTALLAGATAPQIARAQETPTLLASQLPLRADALPLFAPRGWVIEKTTWGDLNRDKLADAALVLVEKTPPTQNLDDGISLPRALVVLLREGKGWRRAGFNASMLLGTRDGGAMYGAVETPISVKIKRGALEIEQDNGSREKTDITFKFRMDKRTNRFYLIGAERSDSDSLHWRRTQRKHQLPDGNQENHARSRRNRARNDENNAGEPQIADFGVGEDRGTLFRLK